MICMYCLKRDAVFGHRCPECLEYLTMLHGSDDETTREYGAQLVEMANRWQWRRSRSFWQLRRASKSLSYAAA